MEYINMIITKLKKQAKILAKKQSTKLSKALDIVAQENGYPNWPQLARKEQTKKTELIPTPSISQLPIFGAEDINESEYEEERKEDIPLNVKKHVNKNKLELIRRQIDFVTIEPTATGLGKSIIDAIKPMRSLLSKSAIHDFDSQQQGPESKVLHSGLILTADGLKNIKISLYRPNTKLGDPRFWPYSFNDYVSAGDQISVSILNSKILLINLSAITLYSNVQHPEKLEQLNLSPDIKNLEKEHSNKNLGDIKSKTVKAVDDLLSSSSNKTDYSKELLERLRHIKSKGPLKSIRKGSTGVGMTVEAALGIEPNSSKKPDYHGIELKSGRPGGNRINLFAQVADWNQSICKSSREILDKYGYDREDVDKKLYCTITAAKPNTQGLSFQYNESEDQLEEWHISDGLVAIWPGDLLRGRLEYKHKETFWIKVNTTVIDGEEYFTLDSVIHTKNPLLMQLMPLIRDGLITMDHLIKRTLNPKPKVVEKGPLFKIDKKNLPLLFPEPVTYKL